MSDDNIEKQNIISETLNLTEKIITLIQKNQDTKMIVYSIAYLTETINFMQKELMTPSTRAVFERYRREIKKDLQ